MTMFSNKYALTQRSWLEENQRNALHRWAAHQASRALGDKWVLEVRQSDPLLQALLLYPLLAQYGDDPGPVGGISPEEWERLIPLPTFDFLQEASIKVNPNNRLYLASLEALLVSLEYPGHWKAEDLEEDARQVPLLRLDPWEASDQELENLLQQAGLEPDKSVWQNLAEWAWRMIPAWYRP